MNFIEYFSLYLSEILMIYIFIKTYSIISDQKIIFNNIRKFLVFPISFVLLMNNLYNIAGLKIMFSFIITVIEAKIFFKDKIKNCIFYTVIYSILSMMLEIIMSIIFLKHIKNIDYLNQQVYFKVFLSILFSLIILLIYKVPKIKEIVDKLKQIVTRILKFYNLVFLINIILIICIYLLGDGMNSKILLTYIILSIVLMIICFNIIINSKYTNNILEEKNKNLIDSYNAYSETIDECKELKHNLKNDLFYLKTSLPNTYKNQVNDLITKYNTKYEWINKIDDIPEGLQGLIYLKMTEAKNKKIKVYINSQKKINTSDKDYLDLCNIVGILLDNAIEASEQTKNKIIEINITETKNEILIKISNNFVNKVDINKIGKKNYSTKELKSGIGLNYIKKVNNSKIKVKFFIINDIFITNIFYKKK